MKLNIKSRKGFTLIELLVVIGILAVLAAIAIPSVAGLIDRANVSADKTNSNEMTNAIERFASEYELFCQDIASGTFNKDNMDSAQGRVYNVLGIEDRAGIELVEIDADEPVDDDAIAIYRDTKYPANAKTAQLIVQNYTKTSSSTFEPKQSDMHYWYSPDCGVIVYAEPDAGLTPENIESKLNAQVISGMDAKGNPLDENTEWIDLTLGVALSGGNNQQTQTNTASITFTDGTTLTWDEVKLQENGTKYGYNVGKLSDTKIDFYAFRGCSTIVEVTVPEGITFISDEAFSTCKSLVTVNLPASLEKLGWKVFYNSSALQNVNFKEGIKEIGLQTFIGCYALTDVQLPDSITTLGSSVFSSAGETEKTQLQNVNIPKGVTVIPETLFYWDVKLNEVKLHDNVVEIKSKAFMGCSNFAEFTIPSSVQKIGDRIFMNCTNLRNVYYEGTQEQWNAMERHSDWAIGRSFTIHFSDGTTLSHRG